MEYSSNAVLPAAHGDGTPPPSRRGRRGRDPLWARLLVLFGATLMLVSGGALVVTKIGLDVVNSSLNQDNNLLGSEGVQSQNNGKVTITGPKNILLIGLDNRPGQNPDVLIRSDSIIILHIAASHDRAYMVSIPRDTRAKIPAYSKTGYAGGVQKINAAYAYGSRGIGGQAGGVELLAKTIKSLYGISFDAAAIVDFTGFKEVVKVLGGVCMYVDQDTISVHVGYTKDGKEKMPYKINPDTGVLVSRKPIPGITPVVYKKGYRCLSSWQALDFVRQRELLPNTDYDRQRHQQQFIKALFKKIMSSDTLTNPIKLQKVLKVVHDSMTVSSGGISIADWALAMRKIGAGNLITFKTNKGTFHPAPEDSGEESLDDDTLKLLDAVRTDTVDQFMIDHQDLVAQSQ